MSEPFVGEIRVFAGSFAPVGWALCNGALVSIAENDLLFSLIGTTYGGDGVSTFGLPDLRGRSPLHQGQGPGLGNHTIGETGGVEQVTLSVAQMAGHSHQATYAAAATSADPTGNRWAAQAAAAFSDAVPDAQLAGDALSPAGGNQPHENMPPYLAVTYIIALYGIYPTRNW